MLVNTSDDFEDARWNVVSSGGNVVIWIDDGCNNQCVQLTLSVAEARAVATQLQQTAAHVASLATE